MANAHNDGILSNLRLPRRRPPPSAEMPLPPEDLRYRVHGGPRGEAGDDFLRIGQRCANDLTAALESAGRPLASCSSIIDFGVGCGRTLRWLAPRAPRSRWHGADIDREAIAWCRANLRFADFKATNPLPPLPYANAAFDLIYAISVLTHLDEDYQFQWLGELRRIARPGGLVVVTLHGEALAAHLPPDESHMFETSGFVFCHTTQWQGIFPDWYQTAFHSRQYVARWFSAFFEIVAHLPQGLAANQDLVVLRRT